MSDQITPSTEREPENATATAPEPPTDFREYVKWRETGELPVKAEEANQPAAAEATPQAKTAPHSGAEPTQAAEDDDEEGERSGRGSSRVRKIDRLTRERDAFKQEAELLKAQLNAQPKPAGPEPPKPAQAPGEPNLRDYPTLQDYTRAFVRWEADQRDAQKKAEAVAAEAKSAAEKLQASFAKSQDTSRTVHADYDDVVLGVKPPPMPDFVVQAIRQAMLEDENGGEVLYYLGTHPEDFSRIAAMSPVSAVREIGRISATLAPPSTAAGKPKPNVSGAPRPPAPLSRPSAGTSKKDILDDDFARSDFRGWSRLREAQLKGQ